MKSLYSIIISLGCLSAQIVSAQLQLTRSFTIGSATQQIKIHTLQQSSEGLMYCGTSKGLYFFDGESFQYVNHPGNKPMSVTALCNDKDGGMLVGYENGMIARLTHQSITPLVMDEGFPTVPIKCILSISKDIFWIGTAGQGLYLKTKRYLYNFDVDDGLSDDYVYDIQPIDSTQILISTDRGLNICSWNENQKKITSFTSKNGLPDNIITSLTPSINDEFILGTQGAGVALFKPSGQIISLSPDWNFGQVNDVLYANGMVFITTEKKGLVYFDTSAINQPMQYQFEQTIPNADKLFAGTDGIIWLCHDNKLFSIESFFLKRLYHFSEPDYNSSHSILPVSGNEVWFWNRTGITKFFRASGKWNEKHYFINQLKDKQITALHRTDDGLIWIGTLGSGLFQLNPANGFCQHFSSAILKDYPNITAITGKKNDILVASFEGIMQFKKLETGYHATLLQGTGNKYVYDVYIDSRQDIWLATDGDGIARYDNGKWIWYINTNDYKGKVAYKITEDISGTIWFASSDAGIVSYDFKQFKSWNEQYGFTNENVTGLSAYGDKIFVFHRAGIDIKNTLNGTLAYLDQSTGIASLNTDGTAYGISKDGYLYFVSSSQLCTYDTRNIKASKPQIILEDVELFLQPGAYLNGHVFNASQNNITFRFTGIYYPHPEKLHYAYKLEGYDKEWVSTYDKAKIFPRLPPGHYTFRVKAGLGQSLSAAAEKSFSFTIKKPFWQTAWFFILLLSSLFILVYLIIKFRVKQEKKWNALSNEKVNLQLQTLRNQINPHFLFNSFNTLISEIESHPGKAVEYVEKLSDFYRNMVLTRDKELIPLSEELVILRDYIFLQQKRFQDAVQVNIQINTQMAEEVLIPPLALQLLVENAIKHNVVSMDKPLMISIVADDKFIYIRNNIQLKTKPESGTGLGLDNLSHRYMLLSGTKIEITQSEETFSVKIPFIKSSYAQSTDH
jgi:ligand-binding sensor domain-containing protein